MKTKIRQLECNLRAWRQRLLDARRFGDAEDVQSAEAQVRRAEAELAEIRRKEAA